MTDNGQRWILYHDWHSICSIMARYAYAIRGGPAVDRPELQIREQACSIRAGEQLTEHFLCDISPHGEVPVLVPDGGENKAIPDSVDITWLFAEHFPGLLPSEHKAEIKRLVTELHAKVNFFSLTFEGKPEVQQRNMAALRSRLEGDISDRYRNVLEHKVQRLQSRKLDALEPQSVQQSVDNTVAYLDEIAKLLDRSNTGWILDTPSPTALDAHIVPFICRLQDIHRTNLIPARVQRYAEIAMEQPAWKETMDGRRTMPSPSS